MSEEVVELTETELADLIERQARSVVGGLVDNKINEALAPYAKKQTNYGGLVKSGGNRPVETTQLPKGARFAQAVRALARAGGIRSQALNEAKRMGNDAVAKALSSSSFTGGGALIEGEIAAEVIELLRPLSVVRQISPRVVRAAKGTLTFPKITTGATASYSTENADIAASEPEFGQVIMSAKKLAGLVPLSNDLLRFDGAADVDQIVIADLVEELAKVEDENFLRGQGVEGGPKGLRHWAPTANLITQTGTTAADVETDLGNAELALEGADIRMRSPFWVMNPRTKNYLFNLRDTNGNLAFPEMRSRSGGLNPILRGKPVLVSTGIPINLGGGTESEIYLVDGNEVILGEVEGVTVDVSSDASYSVSGSSVSAFQRDQTLIRAILHHDLSMRHPEGVAVITGSTLGA